MFCKKCGKEVEDSWNKCPFCGKAIKEEKANEVSQSETMQKETEGETKPKKVWKTIAGIVMTLVLLYLLQLAGNWIVSELRGEHRDPDDLYTLTTEATEQNGVNLDSMPNGFAGWKANGFKGSVVTDISIPYPIKDTSKNNYAVYIGAGGTNIGIIMQKDESNIADWDWLMNATPDEETQEYVFSCVLTYSGQTAGEDEIPVFIISNPESYFDSTTETSVSDTDTSTGTVNNQAAAENSTNKVDYGMIYGGIVDSISAEGTDPSQISYALYDIDKDGILEFLIENSKLEYDVYTTDGNLSKYLGALSDATDLSLYDCKDGNGIYTNYCHMGYQVVKQVSIQNGALSERTIFEGENDYDSDNGKKFDELKTPIQMHTLQDKMTW